MSYTIKVEHPHFPEGTVFNVGGLDRVPNGGSLEIDEEMERLFVMQNGKSLEDAFGEDAIMTISGNSSLDKSELDQLVELYGPQPDATELATEGEPLVDEEETPAWMTGTTTDDESGDN